MGRKKYQPLEGTWVTSEMEEANKEIFGLKKAFSRLRLAQRIFLAISGISGVLMLGSALVLAVKNEKTLPIKDEAKPYAFISAFSGLAMAGSIFAAASLTCLTEETEKKYEDANKKLTQQIKSSTLQKNSVEGQEVSYQAESDGGFKIQI